MHERERGVICARAARTDGADIQVSRRLAIPVSGEYVMVARRLLTQAELPCVLS
jgi:hypothetical protein